MKLKLLFCICLHSLCVSAQTPIWLKEPTMTCHEVRLCSNQRVWLKIAPDSNWALAVDDGRILKTGFETQFDKVSDFDQPIFGHAVVRKTNGDWCIINQNGDIQRVMKFSKLTILAALPISEGFIPVNIRENKTEAWTFLDTAGQLWKERFDDVRSFSGGLAAVKQNATWRFIDKSQKRRFASYEDTNGFSEQFAAISTMQAGGKWGFMNEKGNKTMDFKYDYAFGFKNRRAVILEGDKYGAITENGQLVIPTIHTKMEPFSQDLTAAKTEKGWGFLDTSGRIALPQQWEMVTSFQNNKAWVKEAGKWGIIEHPLRGTPLNLYWTQPMPLVTEVQQPYFQLQLCAEGNAPIQRIEIFVNEKPLRQEKPRGAGTRLQSCPQEIQTHIDLESGENRILVKIGTPNGEQFSEVRRVVYGTVEKTEKRLALLIGNNKYRNLSPLNNAVNDARSMRDVLKALDFVVLEWEDLSNKKLEEVILRFTEELKNFDVGLFFYAGHGMEIGGVNYIIPVDVPSLSNTDSVKYFNISTDWLQKQMMAAGAFGKTNIIILDACRNNPYRNTTFGRGQTIQGEQKSVWKPPTYEALPTGLITAFAVSQGETASDGDFSKNGLYTSILLKYIQEPLRIEDIFAKVRIDLRRKGGQDPVEMSKLTKPFYFKPPKK